MTDQQALTLRGKMLGAMLRETRLAERMSLKEAAALIGTSSGIFSSYEHGRKVISLPELELFTYHLEVPLQRFLSFTTEETEKKTEFDTPTVISLRNRLIGAMLRKQRSESGISIRGIAEAIGLPTRRVSSYEHGERPIPLPELEAIVEILGQSVDDYIHKEGPIGEWATDTRAFQQFRALPLELRDFLGKPGNDVYLQLAKQLSEISIDKLRTLTETLLDLTL